MVVDCSHGAYSMEGIGKTWILAYWRRYAREEWHA